MWPKGTGPDKILASGCACGSTAIETAGPDQLLARACACGGIAAQRYVGPVPDQFLESISCVQVGGAAAASDELCGMQLHKCGMTKEAVSLGLALQGDSLSDTLQVCLGHMHIHLPASTCQVGQPR